MKYNMINMLNTSKLLLSNFVGNIATKFVTSFGEGKNNIKIEKDIGNDMSIDVEKEKDNLFYLKEMIYFSSCPDMMVPEFVNEIDDKIYYYRKNISYLDNAYYVDNMCYIDNIYYTNDVMMCE